MTGSPGKCQHQVFGLVVREVMGLVAIGVAIGLTAAACSGRFLSRFLFGVNATDVVTFVAVPLLLACVALSACLVPARRAMNVAPTEALRRC